MKLARADLLICLTILALVMLIYGQVGSHDFVQYDDPAYVSDNALVQKGLTAQGLKWAFVGAHAANYHPLTWLSHMTDVQFLGVAPGKHHLVNVAFHAGNSVLLYVLLLSATRARWRSAAAAALWAVHPLHVESVAWIAERKDVLSAFFFLLALAAYVRYARRGSRGMYLVVALLLLLGLLSKSMLVTAPAVMLLMDHWPLRRDARWNWLLIEKLPLFAIAVVFAVVTIIAQRGAGAVESFEKFPIGFRIGNAIVSVGRYLLKTIWPADLSVFYPPPAKWRFFTVAISCLLVVAVTGIAVLQRRNRPYLLIGWLWFLGMLVPVIGLVQVGRQAMADRYTYLPHIGLFLAIVWAAGDIAATGKSLREFIAGGAVLVVAALAIASYVQVRYWHNTESLFTHAIEATGDNAMAYNQIGNVLARRNDISDAETAYRKAIGIDPKYYLAHLNLGKVMLRQGRAAEAVAALQAAAALRPDSKDVADALAAARVRAASTQAAPTRPQQ